MPCTVLTARGTNSLSSGQLSVYVSRGLVGFPFQKSNLGNQVECIGRCFDRALLSHYGYILLSIQSLTYHLARGRAWATN